MPKRQNEADGDDEPTGSASKRSRMTPGNASTTEKPPASTGLKNTLHGNVFQLKLLMLFLLRGIGAGFQFRLGTAIPGMGGKFDDLIFKFKKSDQTSESYRFLQAKHKQNEEKEITAADLLKDNEKDFSLPKYFRSYFRDIVKQNGGILPENDHDCIICTNIGFESDEELRKSGIELKPLGERDNILSFVQTSGKKIPVRYRLEKTGELRRIMTGWSEVHFLAKTLLEYVTEGKQLALSLEVFKNYHVALVDEIVITRFKEKQKKVKKVIGRGKDKGEGKLCASFLEGDNSRFREILSELTFAHYLGKLELKRDDTKKSVVDSSKKLTDFDETFLRKLLPKTTSMELDFCIFDEVYDELIAEKVIDGEGGTPKNVSFTSNFLHGLNLSPEGLKFRGKLRNAVFIHFWKDLTIQLSGSFGRKIISKTNKSLKDLVGEKEIGDFLDKLVFAVHTPNEVELDDILKSEVGKYYQLDDSDFQSDFILRKMLDWFKEKDSKFMSSEEGMKILENGREKMESLRVTAISIHYQEQLKEVLEFNDKAIEEMKGKLTLLLTADNRIGRIATPLPKHTAVKVIAALEKLRLSKTNDTELKEYFQCEDSYLVTSSSCLLNDRSKFKKTLKSEHSHNLLVVVCEDGTLTENDEELCRKLVELQNNRIIIISQSKDEVEDKLNFGDLNEKSKRALLEKEIEFQGTSQSTVGDLIKRGDTNLDDLIAYGDLEKVIDCNSIEELLIKKGKILIPTCSSARFKPELYVERQLELPWENTFYDELAKKMKCTTDELQKECTVDLQGCIKWLTAEDSHKEKIWEQMKIIVGKKEIKCPERRKYSRKWSRPWSRLLDDDVTDNDAIVSEKNLIDTENRKGRLFIISGLAGTGKSTILSNYYEIIKRDNPDIWAIRIDLVNYRKVLAEFDFSLVNQSSAVDFFAKIFAKDSPFARSLLTHRFQTDGRIVVMLDGFDEIDDKLHEKVFQLIKAVTLTKMDALYITTRSHLKEELQNQIFQFSYNFKNFRKEDQIDCLSKYWGSKLNRSQTQDGQIQLFAESLVERLTTTLNDRESDFIGIPLQCRVLAECFESQLQDTIQKGSPIDSLIENISENDLNLTSLYSLLMEKKLEIYRVEKFKADTHDHHANLLIDEKMKNLERYLRKLAMKTIVVYPKYVNVLLGQLNPFQTNSEISQEEKEFTSGGVCFGFLDKTDNGEVQFLHRTFAEYLFARYLYAGFLPKNNENCNKLLESKHAQKMIFEKILVEKPYEGVRVFFNSMLKEVKERGQTRDNIPLKNDYEDVLYIAIEETNSNIFLFTCDCLDMTFSKEETGIFIRGKDGSNKDEIFSDLYRHNIKVFKRFMSYYDCITDVYATSEILDYLSCFLISDAEENEKTLEFVGLVVDFLDQRQEAFLQITQKDSEEEDSEKENFEENVCHTLKFFFSNKYYHSLLKKYLKFLHSTYHNNSIFEKYLVDTLKSHFIDMSHETLDYILEHLRILEEENKEKEILKGISHHILIMNSQLFKSAYKREEEEEGDSLPINLAISIRSLLVRDPRGMTRLHRAALYDDEATVDQILVNVRTSYLSNEAEAKKRGKEALHNVIASEEKGVTPLYVAAACEHENLFQKMLIFLKEMLSKDELRKYLTEANGFLGDALWYAMKEKKIKMFRIILKSVKKIFGQDHLIALLKAANTKYESGNVFSACNDKIFLNIAVKVIVDDENGYKHLTDFLFQNWKSIEHLKRIDNETFQKMLSVNRLDDFIKRILDTDICQGIDLVVYKILDKFTPEQREQLFRILITENSSTKSYFARYWLNLKEEIYYESQEILKRFSKYLGQSAVNELLVRNEYEVIKKILCLYDGDNFYSRPTQSLVDYMLSFLSNEKEEVIHLMMIIVLQLIEKITETSDQEDKNYHNNATRRILLFVFERIEDCVKESDLPKLIDLITNRASIESKDINIWNDYLVWNHGSWRHDLVDKFLKCVLDKLGPSAVEELVRKEAVTQMLLTKEHSELLEVLLSHLSEKKKKKIKLLDMKNVPAIIKNLIDTKPEQAVNFWDNILHLKYVIRYADSVVLQQLIEIITQPYKSHPSSDETTSVWSNFLIGDYYSTDRTENVDKFLLCVSDKLGKNKVKELVLHYFHFYGARQIATSPFGRSRRKRLVDAMLAHLTEEDRQEIQRDHVCDDDW